MMEFQSMPGVDCTNICHVRYIINITGPRTDPCRTL